MMRNLRTACSNRYDFVPSIKGISHNPAEHTETPDIVQGIEALKSSLEKLAY